MCNVGLNEYIVLNINSVGCSSRYKSRGVIGSLGFGNLELELSAWSMGLGSGNGRSHCPGFFLFESIWPKLTHRSNLSFLSTCRFKVIHTFPGSGLKEAWKSFLDISFCEIPMDTSLPGFCVMN